MYPLPDPAPRRTALPGPRLGTGGRIASALAAALGAIVLTAPMLAEAGPGLAPSASATGCRVVGEKVVQCSIGVSFNPVENASYYSATLTTPSGTAIPYGQIGAGSASLSFVYAGDGAYTVTVHAWSVNEDGEPVEQTSEDAGADLSNGSGSSGEDQGRAQSDAPETGQTAVPDTGENNEPAVDETAVVGDTETGAEPTGESTEPAATEGTEPASDGETEAPAAPASVGD